MYWFGRLSRDEEDWGVSFLTGLAVGVLWPVVAVLSARKILLDTTKGGGDA
jgi:hypothetical protein